MKNFLEEENGVHYDLKAFIGIVHVEFFECLKYLFDSKLTERKNRSLRLRRNEWVHDFNNLAAF